MVRHYYPRARPWLGEIRHAAEQEGNARSSHQIAEEGIASLAPLGRDVGARITIAEMPPGPPVIQAVVAGDPPWPQRSHLAARWRPT